ncbi:MAG: hypothetical protein ACQKBU_07010 [Verrucomicrobiales bacterium]
MALPDSWSIRSRARKCAATEEAFTEGETIITALFPDPESSGYLRKDYKVDAWETRSPEEDPAFSFWRSTYEAPVVEDEPNPMEKEDPETLLRRLVDEDEEHTENVRYILAVMLERKKLLRETDSQEVPGGILRVYEHRKTGDAYLVRDPNIPLDEVEKVQEEVILLLEHGGRLPTEESDPSPTDTENNHEEQTTTPSSSESESEAPSNSEDRKHEPNSSDDITPEENQSTTSPKTTDVEGNEAIEDPTSEASSPL